MPCGVYFNTIVLASTVLGPTASVLSGNALEIKFFVPTLELMNEELEIGGRGRLVICI